MDLVRLKWNLLWSYHYHWKLMSTSLYMLTETLGIVFWLFICILHLRLELVWFLTVRDSVVGLMQMMLFTFKFHDGSIDGRDYGCIVLQTLLFCDNWLFLVVFRMDMCMSVDVVICIYFEVLKSVIWIDAGVVGCIAFGQNWCGMENMVDYFNMVMCLIFYIKFYINNIRFDIRSKIPMWPLSDMNIGPWLSEHCLSNAKVVIHY